MLGSIPGSFGPESKADAQVTEPLRCPTPSPSLLPLCPTSLRTLGCDIVFAVVVTSALGPVTPVTMVTRLLWYRIPLGAGTCSPVPGQKQREAENDA